MINKTKKNNNEKKEQYYFSDSTQSWIIRFQKENDIKKRNRIYEKYIHNAFYELATNLITVYGFKCSGEINDHFKHDCITFLFEAINKWDSQKGTKAFSYFNVVAKNWLTIHSRRLYKISNRSIDIFENEHMTQEEKESLKFHCTLEMDEINDDLPPIKEAFDKIFQILDDNIKEEKDIKCLSAIKQLYENIDNIEFFNKRAIFVYLREISGLNSVELSSSLSTIRKCYRKYVGFNKQIDFLNFNEE